MIYEQATGLLKANDGRILAQCYSGFGVGKNNPAYQSVHNTGPIVQGWYTLLEPMYAKPGETSPHGPYVIPLKPDAANDMDGDPTKTLTPRSGFLMHGDKLHAPGTASQGCVIPLSGKVDGTITLFGNLLREAIWKYAQTEQCRMQVVSGIPPSPVVSST